MQNYKGVISVAKNTFLDLVTPLLLNLEAVSNNKSGITKHSAPGKLKFSLNHAAFQWLTMEK